jgi:hypothetical protein
MRNFNRDLAALNEFFLATIDGRLSGDAVAAKGNTFFGDIQGPWYTVGHRIAVLVEKHFARAALIECMVDRRLLLQRYQQAAPAEEGTLALWSTDMLKAVLP